MANELAKVFVRLTPDDTGFESDAKVKLKRSTKGLGVTVPVDADTKPATAKVDDLRARVDKLTATAKSITVRLQDKDAQAQALALQATLLRLGRITADPEINLEGATRAEAQILGVEASFDKLGRATDDLGGSATDLGGNLGKLSNLTFPSLIGAAAVLSPVVATLGFGFGGLGIAAAGVIKPIETASSASGGLAANLGKLDPEQRRVAQGLLALQGQYRGFESSLQPTIMRDFNAGLQLAGHLLHDVQPVARATGIAVGQLLGQVDREFQSGQWQSFFTWMAANAGPDVRLLGADLINLADTLPPLLKNLQPVAVQLLQITDGATKLIDVSASLSHTLTTTGATAQKSGGFLGVLAHAAGQAVGQIVPGIPAAKSLAGWLGKVGDSSATTSGKTSALAAQQAAASLAATRQAAKNWDVANSITGITSAIGKGLTPLLNYSGAMVQSKNDAVNFRTALKGSSGQIGLQTQAQRNSFSAANTYITDLVSLAQKSVAAHQSGDGVITMLQNALPALENARSKSKAYWQEVALVKGWLDKLRAEKQIQQLIKVTGTGNWANTSGILPGQPGMHRVAPGAASGMYVRGGTPGRDSVLIRAMPGEVVVPTPLVSAGAVDHLRGVIPGFAQGGIVPTYSGAPAGLKPWGNHNIAVTDQQIISGIARSLASEVASAFGGVTSNALGGDERANEALARRIFPWGASQWPPFVSLVMAESGFNRFARNPSSGAYGIPQALPPTKLPFAGQAAGGSHAGPQLSWEFGYIGQRYGTPAGAWAHEQAFHWYGDGGMITEPIVGVGASGRRYGFGERGAEVVTPQSDSKTMIAELRAIKSMLANAPERTGSALGDTLNGVARQAGYAGLYS